MRNAYWKTALPYLVTFLIFTLIFWRIPINKVGKAIAQAPVLQLCGIFLPFSAFYWLIDSLCLTWVVGHFNAPVRMRDIMPIRASMYLLALVNSNLGQGGVAWYLHRKTGVPFMAVLSSVLFIALMEIYQLFIFSTLGMFLYQPNSAAQAKIIGILRIAYFIGWIVLVLLIGFFAWARRDHELCSQISNSRLGSIVCTFMAARSIDYVIVIGIKAPGFLLSVLTQYYALLLFGISVPLTRLILFLPLVYLAAALPISVAHLGTSQAAWLLFFVDVAPEAKILAYSLAAHFMFMFCNGIIGLIYLPRASRELTTPAA